MSASQSLPRLSLNVRSTAGFPTSGHLWIQKGRSYTQVTYTGKRAERFIGVRGGSGTPRSGSRVVSQSEWDFHHQRDSTRTQLINQSCSNTFYCYRAGTRSLTCMGVRLQTGTPLPYNVGPGGGNTKYSQVWQIKTHGGPILAMYEGRDGLKLVNNYNEGQRIKEYFFRDVPRGKWLRLCIDVRFDSDPTKGAFRLWGDINGDSNYRRYRPLTDEDHRVDAQRGRHLRHALDRPLQPRNSALGQPGLRERRGPRALADGLASGPGDRNRLWHCAAA